VKECLDDDIKDIFGYILQYLHSGDYSVLIPTADKSSHAACEYEIDIATQGHTRRRYTDANSNAFQHVKPLIREFNAKK
jgi:hypothetical protein